MRRSECSGRGRVPKDENENKYGVVVDGLFDFRGDAKPRPHATPRHPELGKMISCKKVVASSAKHY